MEKSKKNVIIYVIFVLSFFGFLDALYLSLGYFYNKDLVCSFKIGNCNDVLKSNYSKILGIPLAFLGTVFYFCILFLSFYFIRYQKFLNLIKFLIFFGFMFSSYLVYLQAFIIKSYCLFCLFSAFICLTMFVLMFLFYRN
jgi:uncharacterized membrane protein